MQELARKKNLILKELQEQNIKDRQENQTILLKS